MIPQNDPNQNNDKHIFIQSTSQAFMLKINLLRFAVTNDSSAIKLNSSLKIQIPKKINFHYNYFLLHNSKLWLIFSAASFKRNAIKLFEYIK